MFTGGATTSQHVDAEDEDHFENTTFKLKRTRSLGLLDEFIEPSEQEKRINDKTEALEAETDTAIDDDEASSPPRDQLAEVLLLSLLHALLKSPEVAPHDDTDIATEPLRHVDYLLHQWDVSDISKSWRYVISKRKDVANAARLENASWRTWAQRRGNLKTISPEVVNWSKDSDVTWLYGPILCDDHGDDDDDDHLRTTTATSAVAGDILIPKKLPSKGPKPILKRRTVQDMMILHSNLLKLQLATNRVQDRRKAEQEEQRKALEARQHASGDKTPEFFDYEAISAKLNTQYRNVSQPTSRNGSLVALERDFAVPVDAENLSAKLDSLPLLDETAKLVIKPSDPPKPALVISDDEKSARHIHFSDEVQQCMAVNEFSDNEDEDYDDYFYDDEDDYVYEDLHEEYDDDEEEEDEDEGGFFLKVRSPSSANFASVPGLASRDTNNDNTEDSDLVSTSSSKVYRTIQLLPSTTLNHGLSDEESDDENPYTSSLSHNVNNNRSRGYDYHYDYNTVYTVDPNHAIYGNSKTDLRAPDVVDVPENISLGSNIDYEIIENNENMPIIDPTVLHSNNVNYLKGPERLPISAMNNLREQKTPFDLSDSDSEDEGLSIGARSSSQSLAQLVFGNTQMTAPDSHFPAGFVDPEPANAPVSAINPNHSSAGLAKQPHSSSSLSQLFFSGGLTSNLEPSSESKETSGLTKQPHSSNLLSDQFLTGGVGGLTKNKQSNSALSDLFFNVPQAFSDQLHEAKSFEELQPRQNTSSPSEVQRKSLPLPPHTTSANAFLGTSTPPLEKQAKKNTFLFEDSDSDSDSEDETGELVMPSVASQTSALDNNTPSYASLSQVADKNGIRSPSPDTSDAPDHINSASINLHLTTPNSNKNLVGQAKGLASQFLNNWKHNE